MAALDRNGILKLRPNWVYLLNKQLGELWYRQPCHGKVVRVLFDSNAGVACCVRRGEGRARTGKGIKNNAPVSYTHLTLPTILRV